MIAYRCGTFRRLEGGEAVVGFDTGDERVDVLIPQRPLAPGTSVVTAAGHIEVGIEDRPFRLLLGPWPGEEEDPAGPLGLRWTPVVSLPGAEPLEVARDAALRAGRTPTVLLLPGDAPALGLQFLVAVREGVEVILVERGSAPVLDVARMLGGRPVAVPRFGDPAGPGAWIAEASTDLHVVVPSLEDPRRAQLRALLAPSALEDRHQLLEVDPRPGSEDPPRADAELSYLAAAAAGVFAGRIAAGNRRWREETET